MLEFQGKIQICSLLNYHCNEGDSWIFEGKSLVQIRQLEQRETGWVQGFCAGHMGTDEKGRTYYHD